MIIKKKTKEAVQAVAAAGDAKHANKIEGLSP